MRFARYLEENAQPEWSRAYLQYRSLKKLIKRVDARHRARLARSNALSRQNSNNSSIGFASARNVTEGLRRRVRGESFSFKQSGRANSENGNTHNQKHREASSVEVDGETGEPAHRDLESGTDWHGDTGAEAGPSRNLSPHGHGAGAEATTGLQPHDKASGIRFASLLQLSRQDAEDDEMDAAADALPPVSLVGTGLHIDPEATAIPLRPRPSRACDRSSPSQATPAPSGGTRPEGHGSSRTPKHSHSTGADSDETRIEEIGRKVTAFVEGNSNGKSRRNGATHADEPTRDDAVHPPTTRNGIPSDDPAIASASVKDRTPKRKDKWDKAKKGQKKASGTNKTFLSIVEDNFDWEERIFFAVLDTELTRIVNFYEERESEYAARFELIAMQLRELSDHRRNFKAREEEERSLLNAVADTAMSKLNNIITVGGAAAAAHGRASQETGAKRRATAGAAAPSSPVPAPAEIDSGARDEGDRRRAIALANIPPDVAARILGDHEASRRENRAAALSQDPERYKYARKKLKTAVLEIYRGLEILKNYGILNRTGFAKILKKAEKTWEVPVADAYFQARVAPSILVTSQRVEMLLKSTEEIFIAYFEHGDRKKALSRLRSSITGYAAQHPSHHLSVFKAGLFLGVAICAGVAGLVIALHPDTPHRIPQVQSLLRVYAALFIPSVFALLFGINLAFWHRARINTVFIFEWDVRHAMDYHQYFQIPSLFLLLLGIFFWLTFLNPFPQSAAPTSWPLVYMVIVVAFMLNPFPIFLAESRKWFVRSILRVFTAGMLPGSNYSVQFRDFFLGDELNSLTFPLSSLWFIGCEYQHHWSVPDQCDPNGTYWTAVLVAVPALLRFLQCWRRWYDSKFTQHIHLINAGKYSTSIIQYFLYIRYQTHGSSRAQDLALWATFATIYSIYTSAWDILMDWSLLRLRAKKPLLRDELCFEDYWLWYYVAMVTNVYIRFGWTIYLYPGPAAPLTRVFIYALLEMLRRFQWNFFRVENEHLGNADTYRVVRDVPLPYRMARRQSEEEEDQNGMRSRASLRLATLRRRFTDPKQPGSRQSSSNEPHTAMSRAKQIGHTIARKIEPALDAHRSNLSARDYAPRQAELEEDRC